MVPKRGLEPPHPCEYMDLNHARLPIPPLRHKPPVHSLRTRSREQVQVSQSQSKLSNLLSPHPSQVGNRLNRWKETQGNERNSRRDHSRLPRSGNPPPGARPQ
jgi:hypothetical protein